MQMQNTPFMSTHTWRKQTGSHHMQHTYGRTFAHTYMRARIRACALTYAYTDTKQ
jgi:hypothetical protein